MQQSELPIVELNTTPRSRFRPVWFCILMGTLAVSLMSFAIGVFCFDLFGSVSSSTNATLSAIQPGGGHAYSTNINDPRAQKQGHDVRILEICEDGRSLDSAWSRAEDITELGRGRCGSFKELVCFSTPDNSDPRTNGRTYSVRYEIITHPPVTAAAVCLGFACGLLLFLWRWAKAPKTVLVSLSILFWGVLIGGAGRFIALPLLSPINTIDVHSLASQGVEKQGSVRTAHFKEPITERIELFQGRQKLKKVNRLEDDVTEAKGTFEVSRNRQSIRWVGLPKSSANGLSQRMWMRTSPQPMNVAHPFRALSFCTIIGVLLVLVRHSQFTRNEALWRSVIRSLGKPASSRAALILGSVVTLVILAGFLRYWNDITFYSDSPSYVRRSVVRTPLYPLFINLLGETDGYSEEIGSFHSADHSLINVVRAQKILFAIAIGLFTFALGRQTSIWGTALLVAALCFRDLGELWSPLGPQGSLTTYVNCLLTECLNVTLIIFLVSTLLLYVQRPTLRKGVCISALILLLMLNRPSNSLLAIILPALALYHVRLGHGWKLALSRAGTLTLVLVMGAFTWCGLNAARVGYFKPHPFSGFCLSGIALQLAEKEDVAHFDNPTEREFVARFVENAKGKRLPRTNVDYYNTNAYLIAGPVLNDVIQTEPGKGYLFWWQVDQLLSSVSMKLIKVHFSGYLTIVAHHVQIAWNPVPHVLFLVAFPLSLILFLRKLHPVFFTAFVVLLVPLALYPPTVLAEVPLPRYQSQSDFLTWMAFPLVVLSWSAWVSQRGQAPEGKSVSDSSSSVRQVFNLSPEKPYSQAG